MAIVKKFDPKQVYISKRLENRLKSIYDYPVTIVEAPTGYGKTTAIREYLKGEGKNYVWFTVDSADKERVFSEFCDKIKTINESVAHKIRTIGYPCDGTMCKQIVEAISGISFHEPTAFIIDNYNLVADKFLNDILKELSSVLNTNSYVICITQVITSNITFEMVLNKAMNYIGKSDFELDREDISLYFKQCGIKLEDNESDFLYQYTEGWISALYLQMLSYNASNSFEPTVNIENLLGKAIWNNLDRVAQEFLIEMSIFNSFTLRQCIYIANGVLSEERVESILKESGLIKYDPKEGKYFIHSILKYFLESEFDKLEILFKKKILNKAGDWYRDNECYREALEFYYQTKNYEAMLSMEHSTDILYDLNENAASKDLFLGMATNLSYDLKKKYIISYLPYVFFMFLNNQRDYYKRECETIKSIIDDFEGPLPEKENLQGEYQVLLAYTFFNDLVKMNECFVKAYELLKRPSIVLSAKSSFAFGNPSPLALYHSKVGDLSKTITKLETLMPAYYKITDGKSKGIEALMRAEMLLNQGEFDDALKLCEKTIYMSSSREQVAIYIGGLLAMCRICLMRGEVEQLKQHMDNILSVIEEKNRYDLLHVCDLCIGYVNVSINDLENIPSWLTDFVTIEENTSILNLGFANVVYGKYLMAKGEYDSLSAISGQMLKISGIFKNILYEIYTLIFIAVVKYNMGNREKAKEIIIEAIDLAMKDNIYIPFVESYSYINSLLSEILVNNAYSKFCENVNNISKKCVRGLKTSEKASSSEKKYGLTKRETEVAKLAAQRMSNKEIADVLFIAESTVKSNLKVIFSKLGVNSRNDLKKYF